MELVHKRLAELWWKSRKLQKRLNVNEINDWNTSLDWIVRYKHKRHWFEFVIARLREHEKKHGRIPAPLREDWERALDANLEHCWEVHKMQEMGRLAVAIGQKDWAQEICAMLDQMGEGEGVIPWHEN